MISGWPLAELGEAGPAIVDPPHDLYLWELMDLDLFSDEDAVEFIHCWGPASAALLDAPPPWSTDGADSPRATDENTPWSDASEIYEWRQENGDAQDGVTANLAEFRLSLATLRDMVRVFLWDAGVCDFTQLCADWESAASPPPDGDLALDWAIGKLNHVLGGLGPRVESRHQRANEADAMHVDVIRLCCLQLCSDLVLERPFRRCDRCGRAFAAQRGRSSHTGGRHHQTARYCSARCASAASSKMHRDRQRQAAAK